jgi:hypothetical protein
LWGEGSSYYLDWEPEAKWLVVEVDSDQIVDLGGKVKFPSGTVVYCGDGPGAGKYVCEHGGFGHVVVHGTATAGDDGTAIAGAGGTATAGYRGTAIAGYDGTATAGDCGTATAGDYGTATAGDGGTATAGDYGTATAGDYGTATADDRGTAIAGECGTVAIWHFNGRRRILVTATTKDHLGIGELEPNTPYRLDAGGAFIRA